MKRIPRGFVVGLVIGTVVWLGVKYVPRKDAVLPGAIDFAVSAPEVKRRVGSEPTTDVFNWRYAVAQEGPYREYAILVSGSRGNVRVHVRAEPVDTGRQWSYEIVALE